MLYSVGFWNGSFSVDQKTHYFIPKKQLGGIFFLEAVETETEVQNVKNEVCITGPFKLCLNT